MRPSDESEERAQKRLPCFFLLHHFPCLLFHCLFFHVFVVSFPLFVHVSFHVMFLLLIIISFFFRFPFSFFFLNLTKPHPNVDRVFGLCQLSSGSSQSFQEKWSKDTPKGSKLKETAKVVLQEERADDQGTKGHMAAGLQGESGKGGGHLDTSRRTANARQQR